MAEKAVQERKAKLMTLANGLVAKNPNRRFDDHCYLRMAYDHALQARWDTVIKRPGYQHLTDEQYSSAVEALTEMLNREQTIDELNEQSLHFRKKR